MRHLLIADKGMVLTDGERYNTTFDLGEGRNPGDYNEITTEEYEKILESQGQELIPETEQQA